MSYKLDKPFTNKQRADFVVKYNHRQGLTIEETDKALYALQPWEILQGDEIVDNTQNYEAQQAQERQKEFNKEFFLTSLGYIRRKVSMSTGETRDFLFDLLPAIKESVSIGRPYPVIVYKQPDFTKEITTEYLVSLQEFKNATEQFCKECTLQIGTDFSGVPMTLDDL